MSRFVIDYFVVLGRNPDVGVSIACDYDEYEEISKKEPEFHKVLKKARYEAIVQDRYPLEDHSNMPLPTKELPVFIFPSGLSLIYTLKTATPTPTFFSFVSTDEKGRHMYVSCLKFYEVIERSVVTETIRSSNLFGEKFQLPTNITIYSPKVISVISTQPFYRSMKSYLNQLYTLSISQISYPLEFYIASLVSTVPLPTPGGRPFHYLQDMGIITSSSSSSTSTIASTTNITLSKSSNATSSSRPFPPIEFSLPSNNTYPYLDLDFAAPLRCLSVANMSVVFTLLLKESKMVFICNSNNILNETMEVLRALLFPLTWATTYVSRLPHNLTGLFEALGGFIVGYNLLETPNYDLPFEWKSVEEGDKDITTAWTTVLAPSTYIIDLTGNRIFYTTENNELIPMSVSEKSNLLTSLPLHSFKRIKDRLSQICKYHNLGPQKGGHDLFDTIYDNMSMKRDKKDKVIEFPTIEIRDLFLMLMIDILGDYTKFMILPSTDTSSQDTFRTFDESFAVSEYIASADTTLRPLLTALVQTQMFGYFIQRRAEGSDPSICFFERAAQFLCETKVAGVPVNEVPSPLLAPIPRSLEVDVQLRAHCALTSMMLDFQTYKQKLLSSSSSTTTIISSSSSLNTPLSSSATSLLTSSPLTPMSTSSTLSSSLISTIGVAPDIYLQFTRIYNKNGYMRPWIPASLNIKDGDFTAFYLALEQQNEEDKKARMPRTAKAIQRRRSELIMNRGIDLKLHDSMAGHLIIHNLQTVSITEDMILIIQNSPDVYIHADNMYDDVPHTLSNDGTYHSGNTEIPSPTSLTQYTPMTMYSFTYPHGWPKFQMELFDCISYILDKQLHSIQTIRFQEIKTIEAGYHVLIRPPYEKLPFFYRAATTMVQSLESNAIATVLLDISNASILLLTLRIRKKIKPYSDILQILGILAELEEKCLLSYVDETIWRCIFYSCSYIGGTFIRQIAWTIYECFKTLQIPCNSETYGAFYNAVNAAKVLIDDTNNKHGNQMDSYLYLEEMGLAWFYQRCAITAALSTSSVNSVSKPEPSPSRHWSPAIQKSPSGNNLFKLFQKNRQDTQLIKCTEAASYTTKHLALHKQISGAICFHQPIEYIHTIIPLHHSITQSYSNNVAHYYDILHEKLKDRLNHLKNETAATLSIHAYTNSPDKFNSQNNTSQRSLMSGLSFLRKPTKKGVYDSSILETPSSANKNTRATTQMSNTITSTSSNTSSSSSALRQNTRTRPPPPPSQNQPRMKSSSEINNNNNNNVEVSTTSWSQRSNNSSSSSSTVNALVTEDNTTSVIHHPIKSTTTPTTSMKKIFKDVNDDDNDSHSDNSNTQDNRYEYNPRNTDNNSQFPSKDEWENSTVSEDSGDGIYTSDDETQTVVTDIMQYDDSDQEIEENDRLISKSARSNTQKRSMSKRSIRHPNSSHDHNNGNNISSSNSSRSRHGSNVTTIQPFSPSPMKSSMVTSNTTTTNTIQPFSPARNTTTTTTSTTATTTIQPFSPMVSTNNLTTERDDIHVPRSSTRRHITVESDYNSNTNSVTNRKVTFHHSDITPNNSNSNSNSYNKSTPTIDTSPNNISKYSYQTAQSPSRRLSSAMASTNILNLQSQILDVIRNNITSITGIFSRTQCKCGFSLLDDEILALTLYNRHVWPFTMDGKKTGLPNWATAEKDARYTCPQCSIHFIPKLHVRTYVKAPTTWRENTDVNITPPPLISPYEINIDCIYAIDIRYMSPREVYCTLEDIVSKLGDVVIDPVYLQSEYPDVFWSYIWYTVRIGTPTGFQAVDISQLSSRIDDNGKQYYTNDIKNDPLLIAIHSPIVVAWREDIMEIKIKNLFTNLGNEELRLNDIFPYAEEETMMSLTEISDLFDGTTHNMRLAILLYKRHSYLLYHLFHIEPVTSGKVSEGSENGGVMPRDASRAREIFIGLLFLANYFKRAKIRMTIDETNEIELIPFCKTFLDTVRYTLTANDFKELQVYKKEMIACVSGEVVQITRQGLGFLF